VSQEIQAMRDELRKSMELLFKLEVKIRDLEEENHNLKLRLRICLSQMEIERKLKAEKGQST